MFSLRTIFFGFQFYLKFRPPFYNCNSHKYTIGYTIFVSIYLTSLYGCLFYIILIFDLFVGLHNNWLVTVQITRANIFALIRREIADNGRWLCTELNVLQTSFKWFKVSTLCPLAHRFLVGEATCKMKNSNFSWNHIIAWRCQLVKILQSAVC